jgi:hypothetical protein
MFEIVCVIFFASEAFAFPFEPSESVPTRAAGGHGRLCSGLPRFDFAVAFRERGGIEAEGLTEVGRGK